MKKIQLIISFALTAFCGMSQLQDGMIDLTFEPQLEPLSYVKSIATLNNGQAIVGGDFSKGIARLNADGGLDTDFLIGSGADSTVAIVKIQPNGKLLVGGNFASFNGTAANMLIRLNSDGTIDPGFQIGTGFSSSLSSNWTPGIVKAIAVQPDGKIYVGGFFDQFNGIPANNLVRLNVDGTLDTSFDAGASTDRTIHCMVLQPDGKLLIGGNFFSYGGLVGFIHPFLARVNPDGSADSLFIDNIEFGPINVSEVTSLALQSDLKILIGGKFNYVNGVTAKQIVRLNPDGTLDNSFNLNETIPSIYDEVNTIALQPDGKILLGGSAQSWISDTISRIIRLNADGIFDASFITGNGVTGGDPYALTLQNDTKILVGGNFNAYTEISRNGLVRLHNGETADLLESEMNGLQISPNPSTGIIQLMLTAELQNGTIIIVDIFGKKVVESTISTTASCLEINLSGQPKGLYYLMISADRIYSSKVLLH
ncbi:MAG: T9SS type A sorting domain-containing protein [Fluviicola sp.]|nr:T9SS type A sorting domain-containing protein [Fluviicola sp.]